MTITRFDDYVICYEDRDVFHTSRWRLQGIVTTEDGANTDRGWLWMNAADASDTVTVDLYKDVAAASGDKVATGTADISGIDDAAAQCALTASNTSGIAGAIWFEDYDADPSAVVPVLVSLCVDRDLEDEYRNLSDLPTEVYDPTAGMARYCAAATRNVLLLVSQMYKEELGGYGAPETRHLLGAARTVPDYRAISTPDQLKPAAVHWALMLAFGACHERAQETMYSTLRDYHDEKRKEAIGAWNLSLNSDPSSDDDADLSKGVRSVRLERV